MLPLDRLRALQVAAISLGLSRSALLRGVSPAFVASLATVPAPAAQLWSDLTELDRVGALVDGSVPLRTWLENALHLAGPRNETALFRAALVDLGYPPANP